MRADRLLKYISVAMAILLIMAWLCSCKSNYSQKVKGRTAQFR